MFLHKHSPIPHLHTHSHMSIQNPSTHIFTGIHRTPYTSICNTHVSVYTHHTPTNTKHARVCVPVSTPLNIYTYMNTISWSLLKDAVSIAVVGFTPKFFWLMCWWNPLLKLKCDFFKLFSVLCNVVWLYDAVCENSRTPLLTDHFCSTCFKVAQKKPLHNL